MKQILLNTEGLQTRAAVVENGRLRDFFIEWRDRDRLVGSIFKGRIRNLEPSLQAAFVDIGAQRNAFLHYWDMLPATQEMLEDDEPKSSADVDDAGDEVKADKDRGAPSGTLWERLRRPFVKGTETAPARPRRSRRRGKRRNPYTVDDIPALFKVDSEVVVQVTKGPIGSKGARVTANLSIPGRYLVLLPQSNHVGISKRIDDREERERLRQILRRLRVPRDMGLICRTVGADRKERHFQRDLEMLIEFWKRTEKAIREKPAPICVYQEPDLVERALRDHLTEDIDEIVADTRETYEDVQELVRNLSKQERVRVKYYRKSEPLFSRYSLAGQIENVFRRQVMLPSGGCICIDETEALIAIDVNSGKNRAGKDHPETIVNTNLEAVDEVARQLRLRNVGGLIVIDLIDMRSRRDQNTVFRALKQALLADRAKIKAYPISPLGLVEMTRQRENESVRSTVFAPCPYCDGKGLIKSATSMSVEIQRRLQEILRRRRGKNQLRVTVPPQTLERLKNEDAALLTVLEQEFGPYRTRRPAGS